MPSFSNKVLPTRPASISISRPDSPFLSKKQTFFNNNNPSCPIRPASASVSTRPSSPNLCTSRPTTSNGKRPSSAAKVLNKFTSGKVELFIRCEELAKMDTFSSSDPICVLFVHRYGQWKEYGRTECIPNCHKPKVCIIFAVEGIDLKTFKSYLSELLKVFGPLNWKVRTCVSVNNTCSFHNLGFFF